MRTIAIVAIVAILAIAAWLLLRRRRNVGVVMPASQSGLTLRPSAPSAPSVQPGAPSSGKPVAATVPSVVPSTVPSPVPRTVAAAPEPGPEFYVSEYTGLLNSLRISATNVRSRTLGRPSIGLSAAVNAAHTWFDGSGFPGFIEYVKKRARFDLTWGQTVSASSLLSLMRDNYIWRYRVRDPAIGKSEVVPATEDSMKTYANQALAVARNIAGVTA